MTKVGIVTSPLKSGHATRGVGFYTKRLLEHLKPLAAKFDIKISEDLTNCELIHYPYFDLFYHSLPIFKSVKTVVTIHDVIPLEFSEHYPPGLKGRLNLQLQKLALNGAEQIITDSYASVKSIHKYLGVPHSKLKLIYLAADPVFKKVSEPKNKYNLPKKFVLYVGDINYNKNIPNLIKACKLAGFPLVIVGKHAAAVPDLDLIHPELCHLQNIDWSGVIRLGFVSDNDLVDIYNLATVYCQPSLAEGFGLPLLEALACGTPVACSNTSSLPEIGGQAVSYFDPQNISQMSKVIKTAKNNRGEEQAKKFNWDKTAFQTLQVYREVLK